MGSNETATATTGGPRVIDVGRERGAIGSKLGAFFGGRSDLLHFWGWRPSGTGLQCSEGSGSTQPQEPAPLAAFIAAA